MLTRFLTPLFLLLALALTPVTALGRTEICGDGIDNDSSGGDLACPSPDADRDGYYSDGTGYNAGTDCDDTNRYVYPGITTGGGCSAGSVRTCQTSGTYTSCSARSGFTCHSGSGATYWISASGSTSAAGSYAAPWDWRCLSNSSLACYHAPVAGDCFVMRGGAYTSIWSDGTNNHHVLIQNRDGTSTDHIKLTAAPGESWWEAGIGSGVLIKGAGTYSPLKEVIPVQIADSDHWDVSGLEITTNTGGFSNNGVEMTGPATGGRVFNNYVHDVDGEEDNNAGCVKLRSSLTGAEVDHNRLGDCYERTATTGDPDWNSTNNSELRSMDCDGFNWHDNVVYTTGGVAAMGLSVKHGIIGGAGGNIHHNVVFDTYWDGIAVSGVPHTKVYNNYLDATSAGTEGGITQWDLGSSTDEFTDLQVYDNTVVRSPCFGSKADTDDHAFGATVFAVHDNVCTDDRATAYPSDGTDGLVRVNFYGSDALYTAMSGKASFADNCYYNSAGTALFFTYFGDNSTTSNGGSYSGLAAWKAAGFDAGSYNENPSLDAYGRATSTHCADKGWSATGGGGTTTTTTTSSTTTSSTTSTTTTTLPPTTGGRGIIQLHIRGHR